MTKVPSKKTILAFDTSGPYCAAALLSGGITLVSVAEEMTRGQAERLMPLLEEMLAAQGLTWQGLHALAVNVGPGNFTGIRIAVSAARGLALGLDIPAYGVTGFEARSLLAPPNATIAIPAPRDQVYIQGDSGPELVPADMVATKYPEIADQPDPAALVQAIGQVAVRRWPATPPPPAPLYAHPADAAPARDLPPVLLD